MWGSGRAGASGRVRGMMVSWRPGRRARRHLSGDSVTGDRGGSKPAMDEPRGEGDPHKVLFLVVAGIVATALSGCSFEIPLHLPTVPPGSGYTARPGPRTVGGESAKSGAHQEFVYGRPAVVRWWTLFHSPRLDALVIQAMRHSPTLAAARAQLREAQANMAVNASIFYPQVTGSLGASRNKTSGASFGGRFPGMTYSLFTGGIAVSYYPDVFGVNRLIYQGSRAQMEYQRDELDAAYVTLAANVVNAAIGEASTQAQIGAAKKILKQERTLLKLTQAQYTAGAAPYLNVLAQRGQVLATEANLAPLQQQQAIYRHQMAILAGVFPSEWRKKPFTVAEIHLPARIPVALPSALVRHRPDIRAAAQQMRYAIAQVGVARAQFFPTVTLSASFGTSALSTGEFFNPLSRVWGIAAALAQPLFEGGRLRAQEKVAYAAFDSTFALYRGVVLNAFRQVADALRAVEHDAAEVRVQTQSVQVARQALELARAGYRSGFTDYLALLGAEVTYENARMALIRANALRYQDTTALFLALGEGDWGTRPAAAVLKTGSRKTVVKGPGGGRAARRKSGRQGPGP